MAAPAVSTNLLVRIEDAQRSLKFEDGEQVAIISKRFLDAMRAALEDGHPLPEITSHELWHEQEPSLLRQNIVEHEDYEFMSTYASQIIQESCGVVEGNPIHVRHVIMAADGQAKVDMFPVLCRLFRWDSASSAWFGFMSMLLGRNDHLEELYDIIAERVNNQTGAGTGKDHQALPKIVRHDLRVWVVPAEGYSGDCIAVGSAAAATALPTVALLAHDEQRNVTSLEDVVCGAITVNMYLEERQGADWPLKSTPSFRSMKDRQDAETHNELQWRASLAKGTHVDVFFDSSVEWLEALVVDVQGDVLLIQTRWKHKSARLLRQSGRIQPLHTATSPWRAALRVGHAVSVSLANVNGQLRISAAGSINAACWVTGLDFAYNPARCTLSTSYETRVLLANNISKGTVLRAQMESDSLCILLDNTAAQLDKEVRPNNLVSLENISPCPEALGVIPGFKGIDSVDASTGAPHDEITREHPLGRKSGLLQARPTQSSASYGLRDRSSLRPAGTHFGCNDASDDEGDESAGASAYDPSMTPLEREQAEAEKFDVHYSSAYRTGGSTPGACGLHNLGNTCFMNSTLQCLAASEPLSRYFLSGDFLKDINRDNVLGSNGRLAHSWGALLRAMHSGKNFSVSPTSVKAYVAAKAPQFIGYQQHDSQEFLAFLLDGLLEDTCRVQGKKPPTGEVLSLGRPDAEVAAEAWGNYMKRNAGKIADGFAGQFRSHVECNECGCVSLTFDPFISISVPIPRFECENSIAFDSEDGIALDVSTWSGTAITAGMVAAATVAVIGKHRSKLAGKVRPPPSVDEILVVAYLHKSCYPLHVVLHNQLCGDHEMVAYHVPGLRQPMLPAHKYEPVGSNSSSAGSQSGNASSGRSSLPEKRKLDAEDGKVSKVAKRHDGILESQSTAPTSSLATCEEGRAASSESSEPLPSFDYLSVWVRQKQNEDHWCPQQRWRPRADAIMLSLVHLRKNAHDSGRELTIGDVRREIMRVLDRMRKHSVAAADFQAKWSIGWIEAPELPIGPERLHTLPRDPYAFHSPRARVGPNAFARGEAFYSHPIVEPFAPGLESDNLLFACRAGGQLSVDLPENEVQNLWNGADQHHLGDYAARHGPEGKLNLTQCLQRFSSTEQLDEDNKFRCPSCKQEVRAFKSMSVWRLPETLILHLKRFQHRGGSITSKINDLVDFPLQGLDMSAYVKGPRDESQPAPVYDLFAVSEHSGGSGGGHYTAHAINFVDGRWYSLNDGSAYLDSHVVSAEAYLLFYRRRDHAGAPQVKVIAKAPSSSSPAGAGSGGEAGASYNHGMSTQGFAPTFGLGRLGSLGGVSAPILHSATQLPSRLDPPVASTLSVFSSAAVGGLSALGSIMQSVGLSMPLTAGSSDPYGALQAGSSSSAVFGGDNQWPLGSEAQGGWDHERE